MNARLSSQMKNLQNEPFVEQIQQFTPTNKANEMDGSIIQGVLNPDNQEHIRTMIAKLPSSTQTVINSNFNHFITTSKAAFSDAVDSVFLVAAFLMALSLIIVFFLPEVPLRKGEKPAMQEMGEMFEDELGQSDDESQPRVEDARVIHR